MNLNHSEAELHFFLARLNSFHETIKSTWEIGYREISFLDVRVLIEDGLFHTDVYSKPTDAHQYLNYKSCHSPHVKRGIPYGQALRFKRICDSNEGFERRLDDLRGFLVNTGYDKEFVERQFGRAREVDRLTLLSNNTEGKKEQGNGVNLVIDYTVLSNTEGKKEQGNGVNLVIDYTVRNASIRRYLTGLIRFSLRIHLGYL